MKQVLEGDLAWTRRSRTSTLPRLPRLRTGCPSGVPYPIHQPVSRVGQAMKRTPGENCGAGLAAQTIPFPGRFRLALVARSSGDCSVRLCARARAMRILAPAECRRLWRGRA